MRTKMLLLVAFLEGFTTLAFQMVALRKAIPYVGSSVVLTSIVIGIILLALSAGYYTGGMLTSTHTSQALLKRLQLYLIISGLYYLLIVYPSFTWTLQALLGQIGFVPTLFTFALIFFALPTFLASHTMPIITHISNGTKGYAAGKILFISTLGSFLGSTLTTLVLFPYIGVYRTGICASVILFLCGLLILPPKTPRIPIIFFTLFILLAFSFHPYVEGRYEETPYQTIHVVEGEYKNTSVRLMQLNGGRASGIDTQTKKSFFPYVRHMVDVIQRHRPQNIAIIGAAGCTLPQEIATKDFIQTIDVVDIDPKVFSIAQDVFLQQELHSKIHTFSQSARGRVYDAINAGKTYDMIVVDAYNGSSIPEELLTQEFFQGLNRLTSKVMMNVITDKKMTSDFSRGLIHTLNQAFPSIYFYDASSTSQADILGNIIFATFSDQTMNTLFLQPTTTLYTDDKNPVDALRVDLMYGR